jgi:hypothetical protein
VLLRGTEGVGKSGTKSMEWKVFQLPQGLGIAYQKFHFGNYYLKLLLALQIKIAD